jgi:transcriptional regulator with XRE-family HTH domain
MARVRAIRESLNLSQETFAENAGLKYKHYQAIEAGRKPNIQLPTLEKLAKACGLGLSELLDFETVPAVLAEPTGNEFKATTGKAHLAKAAPLAHKAAAKAHRR